MYMVWNKKSNSEITMHFVGLGHFLTGGGGGGEPWEIGPADQNKAWIGLESKNRTLVYI